ncbi:S1C family serine protease [Humisphaera borealis]|uniref:PDZ domain-containing protein n=1 Tax=Humisphaera borealis TaxID=2807512 RepID=A0A7M2WUE6_9BACT|nr:PDZ domain-containing protein [Humisphaera borealis]QOV89128.1 PDZ domain-containing protein [Humisphaera borealis]
MRTWNSKFKLMLAGSLLIAGLLGQPAQAQRFRGPDRELSKNGNGIKDAFKEVVSSANLATVKVRSGGKDIAYGTVVAKDGYILTKASELTGDVAVRLRDGTEKQATIVGVAEDHDLAMLKIDAEGLTAIAWTDAKKASVGQWVITPGMSDSPMALGVLSVDRRKIPARSGLLGVMLADGAGGAKVMQVVPDSPAEKAGLRVDDVIAAVNAKDVGSREALIETIRSYMPGQTVKLAVKRGEKELQVEAKLVGGVGPGARAEMMNQMGGALSLRNANFPAVLQHDTVLTPAMCGGPLVTLDGKAIGINIARAGRVESYAIPSDVIEPLLKDLKSGKLAPKSQEKPTTKPAEKKNEE